MSTLTGLYIVGHPAYVPPTGVYFYEIAVLLCKGKKGYHAIRRLEMLFLFFARQSCGGYTALAYGVNAVHLAY